MSERTVYFIKPIGMDGPIKIGCSRSPDGRCEALANWSPFALEVVAEIKGGFDLERRFHAAFAATHERREWFASSPELSAAIVAINAGTFNISTLPGPAFLAHKNKGRSPTRTPTQRRALSLSLRTTHLERRSGHESRIRTTGIVQCGDALAISYVEAFLSDPIRWGVPMPYLWAREAAKKFAKASAA
ncbi:hypothetical protein TomTYG75_06920 [Sphingobium sp. TomTYG75]